MKKSKNGKKYPLKKNYILRMAGVLLIACVLLISAMSNIAARYSGEAEFAQQYVRVAAFNVLVNGEKLSFDNEIEVDLFTTLYSSVDDIDENSDFDILQNTDEDDDTDLHTVGPKDWDSSQIASPGERTPVIAPGNGGELVISVVNLSEVPVRFMVSIDELTNTAEIPIELRVKDSAGDWEPWVPFDPAIPLDVSSSGDLTPPHASDSHKMEDEVVLQWRWTYGDSDDLDDPKNMQDSTLGVTERDLTEADPLAGQELTVKIRATAAQLD